MGFRFSPSQTNLAFSATERSNIEVVEAPVGRLVASDGNDHWLPATGWWWSIAARPAESNRTEGAEQSRVAGGLWMASWVLVSCSVADDGDCWLAALLGDGGSTDDIPTRATRGSS